ncbi:unnamed protein product [Symbiodinium natans]|uniref:Uncharacterized protein n=1 Tax=Symbiodinium natans TaxID=878477 RepID=A0A812MSE0_9DINO|nr:unnamed protein product [Symbiodinium natans]
MHLHCGWECHVALLHRSMLSKEAEIEEYVRLARQLMGFSRFNVLPPGDGLARSTREQSIATGSIPVILDFPKGIEVAGRRSFWPRLERLLRHMVATGRADDMSGGVMAIQKRFMYSETGVLRNIFEVPLQLV